jgi:hypothetical protein
MYRRLAVLLAIGSVPVAVAGLTLRDFFEEAFETPRWPPPCCSSPRACSPSGSGRGAGA